MGNDLWGKWYWHLFYTGKGVIRSGRGEKKERHNFKGKNKETVLDMGEDSKPIYKGISWSK